MFKRKWLYIIGIILVAITIIIFIKKEDNVHITKPDINSLYNDTVSSYLLDELWTKENIYDASHVLQVPMEAAFKLGNKEWKREFSEHFSRFCKNYDSENTNVDKSRLNFLHYLYLSSRFIDLAYQYDEKELIPERLPQIVYSNIESIWNHEEAWQWDREPFENMKERVLWKLQNKNVKYSYYRAIIDEELFTLSTAANLYDYYNQDKDKMELINDMSKVTIDIFENESYFDDENRWLFQKGVWQDHRDYAYAGNTKKISGMHESKVAGISHDSSHFSRFPLLIKSFKNYYKDGTYESEVFNKIQSGLSKQFVEKVLVEPDNKFKGYRLNNYMDGRNGIYRWNYKTQGKGNGYGPYELSGTFFLGWWSFLDSGEVNKVYSYMAESYPLGTNEIETYVGPNTTRERNKYVKWPNYLENGFSELICRLIASMGESK